MESFVSQDRIQAMRDALRNPEKIGSALVQEALKDMKEMHKYYYSKNNLSVDVVPEKLQDVAVDQLANQQQQQIPVVEDVITLSIESEQETLSRVLARGACSMKIMCPTAYGKSTRVPLVVAKLISKQVLVIEPVQLLVTNALVFLRKKYGTMVAEQRCGAPLPNAKVVYAEVQTVLFALSVDPAFYDSVGVIMVDEAHEMSGPYEALKAYLYGMSGNWNVFYMSATFQGANAEFNRAGFSSVSLEIPVLEPGIAPPVDHKLHYSNIRGRTLILLPDAKFYAFYDTFYKENGVMVVSLSIQTSLDEIMRVAMQLRELSGRSCVVLADEVVEYGVTLFIDNVLDFSLKPSFEVDPEKKIFSCVYRSLTEFEVLQRKGRGGRLSNSYYLYMKRDLVPLASVDRHLRFYTVLWLKLLGLKPTREYSRVAEILGPTDRRRALRLLSLTCHPYLSAPYFCGHMVYRNYASAFKHFAVGLPLSLSSKQLCPSVEFGWVLNTMQFSGESFEYYSSVSLSGCVFPAFTMAFIAVTAMLYKERVVSFERPQVVREFCGDLLSSSSAGLAAAQTSDSFSEAHALMLQRIKGIEDQLSQASSSSEVATLTRVFPSVSDVLDTDTVIEITPSGAAVLPTAPGTIARTERGRKKVKEKLGTVDGNSLVVPVQQRVIHLRLRQDSLDKDQIGSSLPGLDDPLFMLGAVEYRKVTSLIPLTYGSYILKSRRHLLTNYMTADARQYKLIYSMISVHSSVTPSVVDQTVLDFVTVWNAIQYQIRKICAADASVSRSAAWSFRFLCWCSGRYRRSLKHRECRHFINDMKVLFGTIAKNDVYVYHLYQHHTD